MCDSSSEEFCCATVKCVNAATETCSSEEIETEPEEYFSMFSGLVCKSDSSSCRSVSSASEGNSSSVYSDVKSIQIVGL